MSVYVFLLLDFQFGNFVFQLGLFAVIVYYGCTVILVTDACIAVFARVAYLERRLSGGGYVCFDIPVTDLDTTVFQFAGSGLCVFRIISLACVYTIVAKRYTFCLSDVAVKCQWLG